MKKFYILDGSGYLYRSYHALPPLSDKDGHNVNAIIGFFRMLFKLLSDKPDYFVIAWDFPKKTKRHEKFPEYKANRPKIPDNFKWQISMVKEIVADIQLPFITCEGYEADDIINTLVKKYKSTDIEIYIDSLDKDLKQLLDDGVLFYHPMKGEITRHEDFEKQMGFVPTSIVDYLAILGDASDNIPGVKGIGEKGASELICKYGTLDQVYANLDNITPNLVKKLTEGKESAYQSKDLISLYYIDDICIGEVSDYDLDMDFNNMIDYFDNKLGFNSLIKSLTELKKKYQSGDQLSLFG